MAANTPLPLGFAFFFVAAVAQLLELPGVTNFVTGFRENPSPAPGVFFTTFFTFTFDAAVRLATTLASNESASSNHPRLAIYAESERKRIEFHTY
jgi:hypothetical protein